MNTQFIYFLLVTAFLDSLNPATIVTQLLLLIKTRSSKVSLLFIVSTYLTYLLAGLALFLGISAPLKKWLSSIYITTNIWTIVIEIIVIILGIIYLVKSGSGKTGKRKSLVEYLTSGGVVLLGIGSTLSDIPTAIPYFAFIAKMEQSNLTTLISILSFSLYTFIYIAPLLIIQLVFIRNESFVIKYSTKIEQWVDRLGKWIVRLMIILIIFFLSIDVTRYFLGMSSLW